MKLEILLVFVIFRFNLADVSESLEQSPGDISGTEEGSGHEDEELSNEEFNAKSVGERLFESVEKGNIEYVQALINSEVDLNLKNNEKETIFQIATRLKDVYENISQIVLNQMEDNVNKHLESYDFRWGPNYLGSTKLQVASAFGYVPLVQKLINEGHDVNEADKNYSNHKAALHYVSSENKPEVVKILIDAGADVNIKDDYTSTAPLHTSASNGYTKVTQLLLENGAEVDIKGSEGETPLAQAAISGHTEDAKLLIEYGANGKYHLRPKANLDVEKS